MQSDDLSNKNPNHNVLEVEPLHHIAVWTSDFFVNSNV